MTDDGELVISYLFSAGSRCDFDSRINQQTTNIMRRVITFDGIAHDIIDASPHQIGGQFVGEIDQQGNILIKQGRIEFCVRESPINAARLRPDCVQQPGCSGEP